MGIAEVSMWSIESIKCSSWKQADDIANVVISNFVGDLISFQAIRKPDGDIIPFNTSSDFRSDNWYLYTTEADAIDSVILQIDDRLKKWQAELDVAIEWVKPKSWLVKRGQAVNEEVWAVLAYIFDHRASMYETKIVEALAADMNVDVVLAKERIRKLRDKGFLSLAGKGNATEGRMTKSAMEVLIEKGLLDAKES